MNHTYYNIYVVYKYNLLPIVHDMKYIRNYLDVKQFYYAEKNI